MGVVGFLQCLRRSSLPFARDKMGNVLYDFVRLRGCCKSAALCMLADRQRTIRELEVGRTLFKEGDHWMIRHQAGDYKTGQLALLLHSFLMAGMQVQSSSLKHRVCISLLSSAPASAHSCVGSDSLPDCSHSHPILFSIACFSMPFGDVMEQLPSACLCSLS